MIRCEYFDPDTDDIPQTSTTVGQIVLQPNHSLSWRALKYFLAFMMLLSFGIAITFMFFGYWLVLPFTGLEMAALSYCLWLCLRRGSLQEVITFSADEVRLETGIDAPDNTETWERFFTKIHVTEAIHPWYRKTVALVHRGNSFEIGAFLTSPEKDELIESLYDMVRRADAAMVRQA
ncbi:MAG: hypothetical protein CMD51_01040 [Gammaproteobacteria bacterium]|jgi:uncharacterized membrane protein|nr:hypothetical protein [Gammaproteobacteria bacterium]|tara:strand:- start:13 stop:543 length:531 start_codon:yes stop_codon:yes gene_type:complete